MLDGSPWPRVSVVVPSLNMGRYIEETIRSVLLQGYPDVELIVIDGASADDSVDVIKKYERWISNWVSEPDRSHGHAINKGFERASGTIMAWMGADDAYLQDAFGPAVETLAGDPEAGFVYGICESVDVDGRFIRHKTAGDFDLKRLVGEVYFWQPSVFLRRGPLLAAGPLDENLMLAIDWDLWLKLATVTHGVYLPRPMAIQRAWPGTKTSVFARSSSQEKRLILRRFGEGHDLPRGVRRAIRSAIAVTYWKEGEMLAAEGRRLAGYWMMARAFSRSPFGTRNCTQGWLWMLLPQGLRKALLPTARRVLRRSSSPGA